MFSLETPRIALDALNAGDDRRCIRLCRELLKTEPANPHALHLLAVVADRQGQYKAALDLFRKALQQFPKNAEVLNNMGITLSTLNRRLEAEQAFRAAIRLDPENRDYLNNLGVCLLMKGCVAEAAVHQKKCIDLGGDTTQYHNYGLLLRRLDRPEEAEQAQREALRREPGYSPAWLYLVQLRNYTDPDHPDIRSIRKLLEETGRPAEDRAELHFALGKCLEDCGLYKQSFEHYQSANHIMAGRLPYTPPDPARYVEATTRAFTDPGIREQRLDIEDGPAPLFIVGMPRTGKTRLERLLAMHPDIHRGGELFAMPELVMTSLRQRFGEVMPARPEKQALLAAATKYRGFIREQAPGKRFVTDTLPANVEHLGIAALLFPDIRIIYLQRDPADTLISIYCKHFGKSGHAYTYQPERIRARQQQYEQLMDAWQRLLPVPILNIHYEDLVRDPAGTAGKVAEYCGLEVRPGDRENWQAAGLNDHWIGRAGRFRKYLAAEPS